MMERSATLGRLGLLIVAVVLATMVFGWVGPLFAGFVFGALDGRDSGPREAAFGAALAWALVIVVTLLSTGTHPAGVIGAALGVPAFVLPIASMLFAMGLAWSSAAVALALRRTMPVRRTPRPAPLATGG
jgi:hypothetical protein